MKTDMPLLTSPLLFAALALTPQAYGATVTWVGGSYAALDVASNWSDGSEVSADNDYVINGGNAEKSLGSNGSFAFAGKSLAVENGSTLRLYISSQWSPSYTVPNFSLNSSSLILRSGTYNTTASLGAISLSGSNTVTYSGGSYTHNIRFTSTLSGSGTMNLVGAGGTRNRFLYLNSSSDASGYAGDWSVKGVDNTHRMAFVVESANGWGSGDIAMIGYGLLTLSTSELVAVGSTISMTATDTFNLGSGTTTIGGLIFGETSAAFATYTAVDLNTLFGTSAFSGTGSLTVIPEPTTGAALLGVVGFVFLVVRRRKR